LTVWDAAVVGAGPAGAVAARELARAGLRTILIDKATFPRAKVCGGCLNAVALAGLGDLPRRLGGVPLARVRLAAGGRSAELRWPGGVSVSRRALDAALVADAEAAKAVVRTGVRAAMGDVTDRGRVLTLTGCEPAAALPGPGWGTRSASATDSRSESATLLARVVIAADGLNGRLAAAADGFDVPAARGSRIGAGVLLPDAPDDYRPGTVFMAAGRGGYVGLVRVEADQLDVAAAFDAGFVRAAGGLGATAEAILREAGLPSVPGLADAAWRGTPPLTRRPGRVAGRRWFAVGDAAGYVEPFTGEGMGWAVASARRVVPFAVRAAAGWDDRLINEWTAAQMTLRRRQRTCRTVAWALRRPALVRLAVRALAVIPSAAGPVVRMLHCPVNSCPPLPVGGRGGRTQGPRP
jgi:flavin-dependent dehydrogenase